MARWISIFPLHGTGRFVVLTDVSQELFVQIRNGSEYPSGDDVALDLAEPQLNLIQPRRVGRSEVQVNLGMHRQEVRDRPALVSREVVGDHMDLFAAGLIDHNVCEERGELRRGVPRSGFTEHLASLGVEGGDRKSTCLNSSHDQISYAVFCLKKKKKIKEPNSNKKKKKKTKYNEKNKQ